MGALDADAPYVANSLPDRDIMGPAHPLKPRVSAATSEKESRAAKYSAPRETEKDDLLSQVSRELSSANDGSEMPNGSLATSTEVPADSGERTPASRSTPSSKRSRLPVFRNMATDNDDM